MISLKKYLDMELNRPQEIKDEERELLPATECIRLILMEMGRSGERACPPVGFPLQQKLATLASKLAGPVTAVVLTETGREVGQELGLWAERSVDYFAARTADVKELLVVLARMSESVGTRDRQYTEHFHHFTEQLHTISNLEDLMQVRASLVQEAAALKTYVDQMEHDSHGLLEALKAEVSCYQTKLRDAEELACRDPLTELPNRRNLEERIELKIALGQAFSIAMVDLNGLKQVNDSHGHLAGDHLLRQFAQELRSHLRFSDLVGRWGGDEFLIVLDGDRDGAYAQLKRLRQWVFGEYTLQSGNGAATVTVNADAAIGISQWAPGDVIGTLIERADAEMYREKASLREFPR